MQSLRITQKLVLAIIALIAVLTIAALFGIFSLFQQIQTSSAVSRSNQENAHLLGELRSTFQTQVQEWKNTLLRGKDPKKLEKYWSSFQESEAKVAEVAGNLVRKTTQPAQLTLLHSFLSAHADMGKAYRKGYETFVSSGHEFSVGDNAVAGIDREANRLLSELSGHITDTIAADALEMDAKARATLRLSLWAFAATAAIGLIFALLFARSLTRPILACASAVDRLV